MAPDLVCDIIEDGLLQRARDGDKQADIEVAARALAGSFRCQVGLLNALGAGLVAGYYQPAEFVERAEVLARMAAATGDQTERRRLAVLLDFKAHELRRVGSANASIAAHIECVITLSRLADEGDEGSLSILTSLTPSIDPTALAVASMGMKAVDPLQRPTKASPPAPIFSLSGNVAATITGENPCQYR